MKEEKEMLEEVTQSILQYSQLLVKIAFTYLKSMHDAEDVVQDVFVIYLTKQPQFRSEEHRRNWLVRCTINKCKDLRKASWYKKWIPIPEELEYLDEEESDVLQKVWKLDAKYRVPIYLHYCAGYSLNEIATMLNKKVSTVGTLLSRGRKKLADMLEKERNPDVGKGVENDGFF